MGGWKGKLIFWLVVYFAGFATAIYCLAPAPDGHSHQHTEKGFAHSALKSDEFANSFNVKMHQCLDYSKDAARRMGDYLKEKLDDS
ncbi:MAG: hypothetical protein PHY02_03840 [Phycisphaerae bacterium]|nr:hypothetical protein [Phycisphaerae bacterium]